MAYAKYNVFQQHTAVLQHLKVETTKQQNKYNNTVEPPNNGRDGSSTFVHYSEVSFMWRFFYVTILAALFNHYGL